MTDCSTNDHNDLLSAPLDLYRGDTWVFPIAMTNPVVAAATVGTPQDLTGYQAMGYILVANQAPIALTVAPQAPDNLLSNGQFKLVASSLITGAIPANPPRSPFGNAYPVRVQVQTLDPLGNTVTRVVIPINVLAA